MTIKSKIIITEINKILQLMEEIDPGGDYLGVYALLLEEMKVIRAALRSTRDLIQTLNDDREMPEQLFKVFYELNNDAIILSEMIEED